MSSVVNDVHDTTVGHRILGDVWSAPDVVVMSGAYRSDLAVYVACVMTVDAEL